MTSPFHAPISEQIWRDKYQLKEADGSPIDNEVTDTWYRIAQDLASCEGDNSRGEYLRQFYEALEDFKFLPAGRITAGAGTGRDVTLFNCFVMGTIPDSMGGIFDMLREAALTMQQGGGIGYDFSTLRPKGALVVGVASDASGPLSFMDCWDAMCRTIMSAGSRRGAMMGTMRCDHPDVRDFIKAKQDSARLRMFNLSVLVTDPFMAAVKADGPWDLHFDGKVYETVNALDLWNEIMEATYAYAEPGVIFIERINKENNLSYCETIAATNPCGEQPLPPYGACLLGSVNLAALVADPYSKKANVDKLELEKVVRSAVRMMDNVVDVSKFPLPQQEKEAKDKRRIGLGVTGLADALMMCGVVYGSDEAVKKTDKWLEAIANIAYDESVELAIEKGAFPLFNADEYLKSPMVKRLHPRTQERIREYGIRNALLTSIAPTGTISLYAGNLSSGIEPVFASGYTRKVLEKDGSKREEEVVDYAVKVWRDLNPGGEDLPPAFCSAQDLDPLAHVKMQAVSQKWVDSSISKTVNCPEDISFEEFKDVYMTAYNMGCKGCTTYRPNEITGSVLSVEGPKEVTPEVSDQPVDLETLKKRPLALDGTTTQIKMGDQPALYVTITNIVEDGVIRPYEIFISSKKPDHFQWVTALTRMISAIFRRPHDSSFVVEELKAVFSPEGGFWQGRYRQSTVAAIGQVIEDHMRAISYGDFAEPLTELVSAEVGRIAAPQLCEKCHGDNLQMVNGCPVCGDCGHSKCG